MGDAQWETGICGCCDVKDCGVGCCCKLYCGGECIFGSAMEKASLGSCFTCCCALGCFPTCVLCNARKVIGQKYGIKEDDCTSCMLACCCPGCTLIQVVNQVLKESCVLQPLVQAWAPVFFPLFRFNTQTPQPNTLLTLTYTQTQTRLSFSSVRSFVFLSEVFCFPQ